MSHSTPYRRILIKLSGESLSGDQPFGIDVPACTHYAEAIGRLIHSGIEVAVVIGGGNLCRGQSLKELGIARSPADQVGMLATLMNGLVLQQSIENLKLNTQLFTALDCPQVAPRYNWRDANQALSEKKAVIFSGGTGNPYFTTDSAAALRASEIGADLLLKATKVDGIYDKDPLRHPDAKLFPTLSYNETLVKNLKVMDATAFALCRDNKIPILVINMKYLGDKQLSEIIQKHKTGTLVTGE